MYELQLTLFASCAHCCGLEWALAVWGAPISEHKETMKATEDKIYTLPDNVRIAKEPARTVLEIACNHPYKSDEAQTAEIAAAASNVSAVSSICSLEASQTFLRHQLQHLEQILMDWEQALQAKLTRTARTVSILAGGQAYRSHLRDYVSNSLESCVRWYVDICSKL